MAAQKEQQDLLQCRREETYAQVQQIYDAFRKLSADNVVTFRGRYDRLLCLQTKFDEIQESITSLNVKLVPPLTPMEVSKKWSSFNELFFSTQSRYLDAVATAEKNAVIPPVVSPDISLVKKSVRLPPITLPKFSGLHSEWPAFISVFRSLVHNQTELDDLQKFFHLNSCLFDSARAVISDYKLEASNYIPAFNALVSRYESKRLLANHYLQKIFEFTPLKASSLDSLHNFVQVHKNSISALRQLGIVNLDDFILLSLSLRNLDSQTRKAFETKFADDELPTFESLTRFLESATRTLELCGTDKQSVATPRSTTSPVKRLNSFIATSAVSTKDKRLFKRSDATCPLCKQTHQLAHCSVYIAQAIPQRYETLKRFKLCFNCLGQHSRSECPSTRTCRSCSSRQHHSTLHVEPATRSRDAAPSDVTPPTSTPVVDDLLSQPIVGSYFCKTSLSRPVFNQVLLGTIRGFIRDQHGNLQPVRMVLDSGSQVTAITHSLVQKLGLKVQGMPTQLSGIGNSSAKVHGLVNCHIVSRFPHAKALNVQALVLPVISNSLPTSAVSPDICERYRGLSLADDRFFVPDEVDVLLGADVYPDVLQKSGDMLHGKPSAISTIFGWVIIGTVGSKTNANQPLSLLTCHTPPLERTLRLFWESEEVRRPPPTDPADQLCDSQFVSTHSRDSTRRYSVKLPFKPGISSLGSNRAVAFQSYLSFEHRLTRNPEHDSAYQAFMQDFIASQQKQLAITPSRPHRLKTFVANRVVEILDSSAPSEWSHVISVDNPADCASRGLLPAQFLEHTLWHNGPAILHLSYEEWPRATSLTVADASIPELKPVTALVTVAVAAASSIDPLARFSTFLRMQRVYGHVVRFARILLARRAKLPPPPSTLRPEDLVDAVNLCVKSTQALYFHVELAQLAKLGHVQSKLASLHPLVDEDGLLRVGGRLSRSSLPASARQPLLLPKEAHLSHLICDFYHLQSLHSGPRTVQALIQQRFWIISLRSLLRQRIHRCLTCYKFRSKPVQPFMSDLPDVRVRPSRPFSNVGTDFAGPFAVKSSHLRRAPVLKGYLCVFVCMCTKAVHLEFVSELSTEAFMACFDRFIARRGLPAAVYSDCGRNYVGAARQLSEVAAFLAHSQPELIDILARREIKWHFNPPYAPNFGGLWEACVKSAKSLLLRLVGESKLTFEEYSTLFARIEAVLNSRPLCSSSSEPAKGVNYLSPGHFLIGSPMVSTPDLTPPLEIRPLARWQFVKQLTSAFWQRWSAEYLHSLMQRDKWIRNPPNLQVGDVVFFYDSHSLPLNWPIGRVCRVLPGSDGVIRVVQVRTSSGVYTRPVNKLVALPQP